MTQRLTQFDFHHVLADTPGVSLVVFASPTCGACRLWQRVLPQVNGVRTFLVDVQQDIALAREFDVFHLPVLFVYRDGRFHGSLSCRPEAAAIRDHLDELLRLPAEEAP